MAGKVGALAVVLLTLLCFLLLLGYIVGLILFGWGSQFLVKGIILSPMQGILITLAVYFLSVIPMLSYGMIIMFFSVLLNSASSVISIGIGLLFALILSGQIFYKAAPYLISSYFNVFKPFYVQFWLE